jgi:hypothetical protein
MPAAPPESAAEGTPGPRATGSHHEQRSALERAAFETVEASHALRTVFDDVLDRNRHLLGALTATLERVRELLDQR